MFTQAKIDALMAQAQAQSPVQVQLHTPVVDIPTLAHGDDGSFVQTSQFDMKYVWWGVAILGGGGLLLYALLRK